MIGLKPEQIKPMKPVDFESQETTINMYAPDKFATLYTCEPKELAYMDDLAERMPEEVEIVMNDNYSKKYRFPKSYYQRPRPPMRRKQSPERKRELSERMKAIRATR